MQKLTAMQQRIYDYIASFIRDQGYPPSVREIGEAVGLKSPSTVHFHIKHLEELGYLSKDGRKGRALTLVERPDAAPVAQQISPVQEAAYAPGRCRCWAMWPPVHPSWRRSALTIISPSTPRVGTGSFSPCVFGASPC